MSQHASLVSKLCPASLADVDKQNVTVVQRKPWLWGPSTTTEIAAGYTFPGRFYRVSMESIAFHIVAGLFQSGFVSEESARLWFMNLVVTQGTNDRVYTVPMPAVSDTVTPADLGKILSRAVEGADVKPKIDASDAKTIRFDFSGESAYNGLLSALGGEFDDTQTEAQEDTTLPRQ